MLVVNAMLETAVFNLTNGYYYAIFSFLVPVLAPFDMQWWRLEWVDESNFFEISETT